MSVGVVPGAAWRNDPPMEVVQAGYVDSIGNNGRAFDVAPDGTATVTHRSGEIAAGLYQRRKLQPGSRFAGPAVVIQDDTTTWVPPGFTGAVDGYGNLILSKERTP